MQSPAEYADIAENLALVRAEIELARLRGAHSAAAVRLLAVSKTVEAPRVACAWGCGVDALAENKVQELLDKQGQLPPEARWHFIGHLQTNKVRQVFDKVELIHSLDSLRLAAEIEKRAAAAERVVHCLIEVNVAAEESKFGLSPAEVWDMLVELAGMPHIAVDGLMTVAPDAPAEEVRPVFAELRKLRNEMRARAEKNSFSNISMQELSMGMSNDYRIAVEEGATMVRVGSSIFGGRIYR
ncbi:MAG: YggS family pyridoxal phosphate-dependent enzyme [Firmicutes bacterium]|nr:YggS family pyridoxal phosphate-dependent enzyme [Bacillota bacterium]